MPTLSANVTTAVNKIASSPTSTIGVLKIIATIVTGAVCLCVGFFGHNWNAAEGIAGSGALGLGTLSGIAAIKSKDA